MPFNLNDAINPDTAPSNLIGQVNGLANQIKRLIGGDSWKSATPKSISVPISPIIGQYWDEIDPITKEPIANWYWNGTYWVEREDRFLHNQDSQGRKQSIPSVNGSNKILIKTLKTTTIAGFNNSASVYNRYQYFDANTYATGGILIGEILTTTSNGTETNVFTKTINTVFSNMVAFAVWWNYHGSEENVTYTGHLITYRCVR